MNYDNKYQIIYSDEIPGISGIGQWLSKASSDNSSNFYGLDREKFNSLKEIKKRSGITALYLNSKSKQEEAKNVV